MFSTTNNGKQANDLRAFGKTAFLFVMTFCGIFTSALMPLFMSFGGVGFGDNIDVALKDGTLCITHLKA